MTHHWDEIAQAHRDLAAALAAKPGPPDLAFPAYELHPWKDAPMETVPARRGDLAVLEIRNSYHSLVEGRVTRTAYELHRVASITRDGRVTRVTQLSAAPHRLELIHGLQKVQLVSQSKVDVEAALHAAWTEHTWPGSILPAPFDALDEVRQLLARFDLTR